MKEISDLELMNINGGFNPWLFVGIGLGVTFLIGLADGYVRPPACH